MLTPADGNVSKLAGQRHPCCWKVGDQQPQPPGGDLGSSTTPAVTFTTTGNLYPRSKLYLKHSSERSSRGYPLERFSMKYGLTFSSVIPVQLRRPFELA